MFIDIIKINKMLLWDVIVFLFIMLVFIFGMFIFELNVDVVFGVIFNLGKFSVEDKYL